MSSDPVRIGEFVRFFYGPGDDYFEAYVDDAGRLDVRAPRARLSVRLTGGVNHVQIEAVERG